MADVMERELVVDGRGSVRWRDTGTKKWTKAPSGVSVNTESILQNVHSIPGWLEPGTAGPSSPAVKKGLFQQTVSVEDLRELYHRDELLFSSLEILSRDVFSKWATITARKADGTENVEATKKLMKVINRTGFVSKMRIAFRSRLLHGVAVLALIYPGKLDAPLETDHRLLDVKVVPWDWIDDWQIDLDPDSENYAEVAGVLITRTIGDSKGLQPTSDQLTIHKGRFMHWPMPDLDGTNPWGMSKILPLHDMLTIKKNVDWSLGEALFQHVTGKTIFILPGTTDDSIYKQFKKDIVDLDVTSQLVARGEGLEIIRLDEGRAGVNVEPYTQYFMALLAAGLGVPYPMLYRGLTGAAGEIIQNSYSALIHDIQTGEVEPLLRDFIELLDISSVAEWDIDWIPFQELNEEEQSFVRSRFALARQLTGRAVDFFLKNGISVEFNQDGWIKRVFIRDSEKELVAHPPDEPEPTAPQPPGGQPGEPAGGTPTPGEPPEPQTPEGMEKMLMPRNREDE